MKHLTRALPPLVPMLILSLLLPQLPAAAATARRANPVRTVPVPFTATNDIIALPLNPVLPAGQRLCAAKTAFGLGYTMLRAATGTKPTKADYVLVNYIGFLAASGVVFDQGMRSTFPVGGVIPGFTQGLEMMAKSGIARFCIPAALGYGEEATGPIPANSDLVFQVELIDYKTAAEIEAMRKAQAADQAAQTDSAKPPQ